MSRALEKAIAEITQPFISSLREKQEDNAADDTCAEGSHKSYYEIFDSYLADVSLDLENMKRQSQSNLGHIDDHASAHA